MVKKAESIKTIERDGKTYIPILDFMRAAHLSRITAQNYVREKIIDGFAIGRKWWVNKSSFGLL